MGYIMRPPSDNNKWSAQNQTDVICVGRKNAVRRGCLRLQGTYVRMIVTRKTLLNVLTRVAVKLRA